MKQKEIMFLMNWFCLVVSSVAGVALEQVYNTSHDVVQRVATDQADPCLPSNHRNITHIGHRNINVRGTCPYTDGRLEDAWYHAGPYPISSYRHIPEMCSCGYKFPIWMNGSMPGVEEGIVSRTTCMRFGPFTCDQTINIQIKNCGNDFVYHLSATPDDSGYCFDVTTAIIISSASSPSTVSNTITTSQTTATSTQDVTTASLISSASSPSTVSSTITTSQTTATSTQDATTASSTTKGIPHTSASSSRSTSQTTARYTENSTTNSTSRTLTMNTSTNATVTRAPQTATPKTANTSTEQSTMSVGTSPYYTNSSTSVTRSTSHAATTSTRQNSEQKTNVATRLTSFPLWPSTTNSSWYDLTTAGTKLQDAIFVNCGGFGWNISIDMNRLRVIYPNSKSSDIYLGENHCTGVLKGWNTLLYQQGLKECLTSEMVRENEIVYSNELIYAERDPHYQFIIRYYNWTVRVECDVQRNETSSGHLHHESNNLAHPTITGNSHFSVNMSFYSDSNFKNQLQGNPLHVTVGDKVYVKVYTTTSDWTVKMSVHTCYTKPVQYSPDHLKYYIIQNGCEVDTNTHIISQSTHETTFVFQDFEYTTSHEGIHLFCDAIFCGSNDLSPQCQQTCNPVVGRGNIPIEMIGKE